METHLFNYIVTLSFALSGFIIGWLMPRGRSLKALQLRTLKSLHNFFADEEEYIHHKAIKIKRVSKKVRGKL